jgi:hypothetical protein
MIGARGLKIVTGPLKRPVAHRALSPDLRAALGGQSFWEGDEDRPGEATLV